MKQKQTAENSPQTSFIERLARTLGAEMTAAHIFGAPVERDGVTIIPVAKARYGFGGGGRADNQHEGSGGGSAAVINPVGYIEIADGSACFRPIRNPLTLIPALAAGGLLGLLAARGLAKLLATQRRT